jgi:hypothetical protein
MENQIIPSKQLSTPQLVNTVQQLSTSLQAVQPLSLTNSETTQLITYTLIATAIVGIVVYHYIKNQEQTN